MKLAQLQYETAFGMTPRSRAQLKLSTTRAALDLRSAMIDDVIEVGESRKREAKDNGETRGNYENTKIHENAQKPAIQ